MDYAELKAHIAKWLDNRSDLVAEIPTFISDGEMRLNRDPRVRKQSCRGTFIIQADAAPLPADYRALDSWYHDGPTFFGPIEIVSGDSLPDLKRRGGITGPPAYAAVMGRQLFFAPEPNATYETRMSYWRRIPPLSDETPTNWFLEEHADMYRLAALCEASPYLRDDERLAIWEQQLERRLEALHAATSEEIYSGSLVRRFTPIG